MLTLLVFMHILQIYPCFECPVEYSTTTTQEKILWKSRNTHYNHSVVVSVPSCLDSNSKLITRLCTNGEWIPAREHLPECQKILEKSRYCPDNFLYFDDHCIFLNEESSGMEGCKYTLENQSNVPIREKLWLPLRRVENFGPFQYIILGSKYGKSAKLNKDFAITNFTNYLDFNCLLFDTAQKTTTVENCNNRHKRLCAYHHKYTNFFNCPKNCKSSGLDVRKCYCKNSTCKNLATINSFYERAVVEKLVRDGDEFCEIGGETQMAESLKPFISKKGEWFYGNYKTNCCVSEERPLLFRNDESIVTMTLSFEKRGRDLCLLIYNASNLLQTDFDDDNDNDRDEDDDKYKNDRDDNYDGDDKYDNDRYDKNDSDNKDRDENTSGKDRDDKDDEDSDDDDNYYDGDLAVYCFTDASKYLKKRVKISKKFHSKDFAVFSLKLEKYVGQYWCEAFTKTLNVFKSPKTLAYKKRSNDYSLHIVINNLCVNYNCKYLYSADYHEFIDQKFNKIFQPLDVVMRVGRIVNVNVTRYSLELILKLNVKIKNEGDYNTEEFYILQKKLQQLPSHIKIISFKNSEYCLPIAEGGLNWPLTNIHTVSPPVQLCPLITRTCKGSFIEGAEWSPPSGHYCDGHNKNTEYFYNQSSLITTPTFNNFNDICNFIVETTTEISVSDLYYLSKILGNFRKITNTTNVEVIEKVLEIADKLLNKINLDINHPLTKQSTEDLLEILENVPVEENGTNLVLKNENLVLHIIDPFESNITGLYLIGDDTEKFTNFTIFNIEKNSTLDFLNQDNFHLAVFIPEQILQQMQNTSDKIITTIFYNDDLFISDKGETASSYVVSVSIPGFGNWLQTPLSIYYKNHKNHSKNCGFWDKQNKGESKWSTLGGNWEGNKTLSVCSFVHLTHFALLVMSDDEVIIPENYVLTNSTAYSEMDLVLNVLTLTGGVLSVLGVIGIFLTACLYKNWRKKTGTKILLNLSLAIIAETICTQLAEIDAIKSSDYNCKVAGVFLHYIVLSQFVWMLIYAVLQYIRFVVVFSTTPKHFCLKAMLVGWGFPLLPAILAGSLTNTPDYNSKLYEICYPRGIYLYTGVLIPIVLIIIFNFIVFCIVMYHVVHLEQIGTTKSATTNNKLQVYLAILLFFILGMPWMFAILGKIIQNLFIKYVFYYIFCITATCQGFVLFLFYVVFNKDTKKFWVKFFKDNMSCCGKLLK